MRFESPYAFLLLLLIPALVYWNLRRRSPALRMSATLHAREAGYSIRQHFVRFPLLLRVIALVLFTIALARPQEGREHVRDVSEGVAIEMVVDRSGSMGEEMDYHGRAMTKLDVVKKVFEQFLFGGGGLSGRPNDLIGLVTFARYADTNCPLTLGHSVLASMLDRVELPQTRDEDGTAIGDALALGAARLKTAETELSQERKLTGDAYRIKSKVIILLTDGQNNRGERQPMEAAALAAEWGIKVYVIGVGGNGGGMVMNTPLGPIRMGGGSDLDEDTLKAIAAKTGGQYFRADDGDALNRVYETIDQLEKSEIQAERYLDYREWFMPFALLGLGFLALEILLSCTVFRRVP